MGDGRRPARMTDYNFEREARTLEHLDHARVPKYYDYFHVEEDGAFRQADEAGKLVDRDRVWRRHERPFLLLEWNAMLRLAPRGEIAVPMAALRGHDGPDVKWLP